MSEKHRIKQETSAGGVVFRRSIEGIRFLLIKDPYRKWGLPKGHVHPGERLEETARREVAEETGLHDLILHAPLGEIDWYFSRRGTRIHKSCHFFLIEAPTGVPCPQAEEGILMCQWFTHAEAMRAISYDNARSIVGRAGSAVSERFKNAGQSD